MDTLPILSQPPHLVFPILRPATAVLLDHKSNSDTSIPENDVPIASCKPIQSKDFPRFSRPADGEILGVLKVTDSDTQV